MGIRHLVPVLGDQLDPRSLALEDFDADQDLVWMAEVPKKSQHVRSHKARTALFFAAMRHFAKGLEERDIPVRYSRLSAAMNLGLLSPRTTVDAAVAAYRSGAAPLASVEGFVRQIIGWREFVRGLYWTRQVHPAQERLLPAVPVQPG